MPTYQLINFNARTARRPNALLRVAAQAIATCRVIFRLTFSTIFVSFLLPFSSFAQDASASNAGRSSASLATSATARPQASALDTLRVLALSAVDGSAVILFPNGKMHTIRRGENLPGTKSVLKAIMADKVVLEESDATSNSKQLVWIAIADGAKAGRVERFSTTSPVASQQRSFKVIPIQSENEKAGPLLKR